MSKIHREKKNLDLLFQEIYAKRKKENQKKELFLHEFQTFSPNQSQRIIFLLPGLNNTISSFKNLAQTLSHLTQSYVILTILTGHSEKEKEEVIQERRSKKWIQETTFWIKLLKELSDESEHPAYIVSFSTGTLLIDYVTLELNMPFPHLALAPAYFLTWKAQISIVLIFWLPFPDIKHKNIFFSFKNIKAFREIKIIWNRLKKKEKQNQTIIMDPRDEIIHYKKMKQNYPVQEIYLNSYQWKIFHLLNILDFYGDQFPIFIKKIKNWLTNNEKKL